jgi:spore germination protein
MVTDRQLKRTLVIELLSTTGLFVSAMAQNLQQLLVGFLMAVCYAGYFLWIGKTYDIRHTGKLRRIVYMLRFFIYACFLGNLIRLLVDKMLLPGGSSWYLIIPVFLLAIYANHKGRAGRVRLLELLFWFILVPLLLVMILAAKEMHPSYLIQNQFVVGHSIEVFLCFSSLEILLFYRGATKEKCKALGIVFLLNFAIFAITIGMYGYKVVENSDFPVVTMIQMVRFPGGFIERLDILILAFWILSLFAIFSAYCFYGTEYCWGKNPWIFSVFYLGVFLIVGESRVTLSELLRLFQNYLLWIDIPLAVCLPLLGNRKRQRAAAFTMISVIALIVTGCSPDRVNIEDRAYVLAMEIEQKDHLWSVSFFLPENEIVQIKGTNWNTIAEKFKKSNDKKLELSHVKAMIVGEGADWEKLQEWWEKDQEYSKTVLLFQTEESASAFAAANQNQEKDLGNFLADLAQRNKRETTLGEYLAGTKSVPTLSIRTNLLILK